MSDIKFSELYSLKKTQIDLEFVDIYVNKDLPLFLDPWAIKCSTDMFGEKCNSKIVSFFNYFIGLIKDGKKTEAIDLLGHLSELKETRLGTGKKGYTGSGIGGHFSEELYNAFIDSEAIKTGNLQDLEDTVLVIDNIGPDRISDMITNIISDVLVEYTQIQCELYGIETKEVQGFNYWDNENNRWEQQNRVNLPYSIDYGKILLVPKWYVRLSKQYFNHSNFYAREILEFEQSLHLSSGSGLCRLLKDGTLRKPTKEDLEDNIPLSKKLVGEYIAKYPKLLEDYKVRKIEKISDEQILGIQGCDLDKDRVYEEKISEFGNINVGRLDADKFHNHIMDCLNDIFLGELKHPKKEERIHGGRKRIDISYQNSSIEGFFTDLSRHSISCAKIFFECKNYSQDLGNPEYDQLLGRFNTRSSTIGFIVCRNISDKGKMIEHCKDYVFDQDKYIIVLDDNDIVDMLNYKKNGEENKINEFLGKKLSDIITR